MFIYSVVNTTDTDQEYTDQEYELEVYDAAETETVADLDDDSDTEYLASLARYYGLHT